MAEYTWKLRISPFGVMRRGIFFAEKMINGFANIRLRGLKGQEYEDYKDYLYQTFLKKGSTEYALFNCYDHLMFAHHPLESADRLGLLPIPVSFIFGDRDWFKTDAG
jgi:hypothetical protein